MLLYPGGTALDSTTRGYSFFGNSLSDLGSTVAWGGQANTVGAMLFTCGFCLVAIGCGACAVAMVHLYTASAASRTSARAAAGLGLLSCAALAGAALTPQDLHLWLHRELTTVALWGGIGATMLMALAAANEPRIRRRISVSWVALGVVLGVWLCVTRTMPSTAIGFVIAVTLQKLVAIALVATVWLQTGEAGRIARGETQRWLNDQESL